MTEDVSSLMLHERLRARSVALWVDLDRNGGEGWADQFTADGIWDFNGSIRAGRDALAAHFAARRTSQPRTTVHLLSNMLVREHDHRHVTVEASITVFAGDGPAPLPITLPSLVGTVEDHFVSEADEVWRVALRRFRPLFFNPADRVGQRVAHG